MQPRRTDDGSVDGAETRPIAIRARARKGSAGLRYVLRSVRILYHSSVSDFPILKDLPRLDHETAHLRDLMAVAPHPLAERAAILDLRAEQEGADLARPLPRRVGFVEQEGAVAARHQPVRRQAGEMRRQQPVRDRIARHDRIEPLVERRHRGEVDLPGGERQGLEILAEGEHPPLALVLAP